MTSTIITRSQQKERDMLTQCERFFYERTDRHIPENKKKFYTPEEIKYKKYLWGEYATSELDDYIEAGKNVSTKLMKLAIDKWDKNQSLVNSVQSDECESEFDTRMCQILITKSLLTNLITAPAHIVIDSVAKYWEVIMDKRFNKITGEQWKQLKKLKKVENIPIEMCDNIDEVDICDVINFYEEHSCGAYDNGIETMIIGDYS